MGVAPRLKSLAITRAIAFHHGPEFVPIDRLERVLTGVARKIDSQKSRCFRIALFVTTFFSLSAGFVASVICRRQFLAIATALGLALAFSLGLMGAAAAMQGVWKQAKWAEWLALFSPLYLLQTADGTRFFGTNRYWISFGAVSAMSLGWLALVTWQLARTWRDQEKSARGS